MLVRDIQGNLRDMFGLQIEGWEWGKGGEMKTENGRWGLDLGLYRAILSVSGSSVTMNLPQNICHIGLLKLHIYDYL